MMVACPHCHEALPPESRGIGDFEIVSALKERDALRDLLSDAAPFVRFAASVAESVTGKLNALSMVERIGAALGWTGRLKEHR